MTELLHLRAETAADLTALSALVQDMTVAVSDIVWDRRAARLVLAGNRFRHEAAAPSRVRALLRLDFVRLVRRHRWPERRDTVLPLLAVLVAGGNAVDLCFGGGARLRALVECLDLTLEDLGGPRPARYAPRHPG